MASEKKSNTEKAIAIIYPEGKTDWKHLKKAKEKLKINLNIAFHEDEESLGSQELLNMCQYLSKRPDGYSPVDPNATEEIWVPIKE